MWADELVNEFGLDQTRYFLMREVPFGNDGNFSRDRMIAVINSELANNIGNLVQRTLSMINKNCGGIIPQGQRLGVPLGTLQFRLLFIGLLRGRAASLAVGIGEVSVPIGGLASRVSVNGGHKS